MLTHYKCASNCTVYYEKIYCKIYRKEIHNYVYVRICEQVLNYRVPVTNVNGANGALLQIFRF